MSARDRLDKNQRDFFETDFCVGAVPVSPGEANFVDRHAKSLDRFVKRQARKGAYPPQRESALHAELEYLKAHIRGEKPE